MIDESDLDEIDKSLHATLHEVYEEFTAFYEELNGESARAAAILVVAKIEDELITIIKRYFPPDVDEKVLNRIFGPGRPISDLKNKTNLLEAFGAFGPRTRVMIERLGSIRNKFAHQTDVRTFKHDEVIRHCRLLGDNPVYRFEILDSASEKDVRWNFITAAKCLHGRLEMISPHVSGLGDPDGPLP